MPKIRADSVDQTAVDADPTTSGQNHPRPTRSNPFLSVWQKPSSRIASKANNSRHLKPVSSLFYRPPCPRTGTIGHQASPIRWTELAYSESSTTRPEIPLYPGIFILLRARRAPRSTSGSTSGYDLYIARFRLLSQVHPHYRLSSVWQNGAAARRLWAPTSRSPPHERKTQHDLGKYLKKNTLLVLGSVGGSPSIQFDSNLDPVLFRFEVPGDPAIS